jgi:hypothetical protein
LIVIHEPQESNGLCDPTEYSFWDAGNSKEVIPDGLRQVAAPRFTKKHHMNVVIPARLATRRGGLVAWSESVGLTGHGSDEASAMQSLERAARAWCVGLRAAGELERCLSRRGVSYEVGETTDIQVSVIVA